MSVTAARHLVEKLTEQGVCIFVIRDFDKAGFTIAHTLKTSTKRYKFKITPNLIDLGLRLDDLKDLDAEDVEYVSNVDPREDLIKSGALPEEAAFLRSGGNPGKWTGKRVELNAMTSPKLLLWLEKKLKAHGVEKFIPGKEVLENSFRRAMKICYLNRVLDDAKNQYSEDNIKIPEDLSKHIHQLLLEHRELGWDKALQQIVMLSTNTDM